MINKQLKLITAVLYATDIVESDECYLINKVLKSMGQIILLMGKREKDQNGQNGKRQWR